MIRRFSQSVLCAVGLLAAAVPIDAQQVDHQRILAPLLTQETVAVGYVDLAAIDFANLERQLLAVPGLTDADKSDTSAAIGVIRRIVDPLRQAGARFGYVVMGTGDVSQVGGPLVFVPLTGEGAAETLAQLRLQIADAFNELTEVRQGQSRPLAGAQLEVRSIAGIPMLLTGMRSTLDRYPPFLADPRDDLTGPLSKLAEGGATVGGVGALGPDHRRVLREMWPHLPEPYAKATGSLLADGIQHISLSAKLPPEWSGRFVLEADAAATARTLADVVQVGLNEAGQLVVMQSTTDATFLPAAAIAGQVVALLTPTVDETRLVIDLRHDDERLVGLQQMLQTVLNRALEQGRRAVRLNHFKQLALAMHNFHDTQKHFPASDAICDAAGRPLLSWRVLILPFVDESELFQQFHLDEPWDSPHNRQLIEKMPELFSDPAHPGLGREGKTTYQMPVHTQAAFLPHDETPFRETTFLNKQLTIGQGIAFREITDGTSQTIMLVDVAASEAVIWTKPDDWEVDLADPHRGLTFEGRREFVTARCDGSAHVVPLNVGAEKLRALLTRAGREVIDR